ncbi:MAG: acyl carrier protein [Bacteroidales bacterium]|nr:acyl carrier protein [Bacteroidales bacterium]
MKKEDFFRKLIDELELEESEINENSPLTINSLKSMILISFLDEHFGLRVKSTDLQGIDSVSKLISLIGEDKLE